MKIISMKEFREQLGIEKFHPHMLGEIIKKYNIPYDFCALHDPDKEKHLEQIDIFLHGVSWVNDDITVLYSAPGPRNPPAESESNIGMCFVFGMNQTNFISLLKRYYELRAFL